MPWGLAAAAGASLIGGVIASDSADKSASGQQAYAEKNSFMNSGLYDSNQFSLGGDPRFAENQANSFTRSGNDAQTRMAPTTDYTSANSFSQQGIQDAAQQRNVAGLMMARANGSVPSIAQQQAALQSQQLVAQQASQAASARGAAGLALAGQQAATNTANGQAAISGQAQINAATERLQAEQAATGAYGNLRAGDIGAQQQSAQQAQFNSGLAMQQRQANDQYQQQMTQNAMNTRNTQLQANVAQQQFVAGEHDTTTSQALGIQARNAQNQQQIIGGVVSGISNAATSGVTGGAKAEGGPINAGTPYLVGEKGPELVVPQQSGTVIPAGPTAQMTGDASGLMAAAQDPKKAAVLRAAQQNPQIGMHLRQQAMNDPATAAKVQADPALLAIAMGRV